MQCRLMCRLSLLHLLCYKYSSLRSFWIQNERCTICWYVTGYTSFYMILTISVALIVLCARSIWNLLKAWSGWNLVYLVVLFLPLPNKRISMHTKSMFATINILPLQIFCRKYYKKSVKDRCFFFAKTTI